MEPGSATITSMTSCENGASSKVRFSYSTVIVLSDPAWTCVQRFCADAMVSITSAEMLAVSTPSAAAQLIINP